MSSGMMGSPAAAWLCHTGEAHSPTAAGNAAAADDDRGKPAVDQLPSSSNVSSSAGRKLGCGGQGCSVVAYADGYVAAV